jgi:hypothetical protein
MAFLMTSQSYDERRGQFSTLLRHWLKGFAAGPIPHPPPQSLRAIIAVG